MNHIRTDRKYIPADPPMYSGFNRNTFPEISFRLRETELLQK